MSKQAPIFVYNKRVTDITPAWVIGSGRYSNGRTGTVKSLFKDDRVNVLYDADELNGPKDFWIPYEFLRFDAGEH